MRYRARVIVEKMELHKEPPHDRAVRLVLKSGESVLAPELALDTAIRNVRKALKELPANEVDQQA